jgi:hypothetical protein
VQARAFRHYHDGSNPWSFIDLKIDMQVMPGETRWGCVLRGLLRIANDSVLAGKVEFLRGDRVLQTLGICGNIGAGNAPEPVLLTAGRVTEASDMGWGASLTAVSDAAPFNTADGLTPSVYFERGPSRILVEPVLFQLPYGCNRVRYTISSTDQSGSGLTADAVGVFMLA